MHLLAWRTVTARSLRAGTSLGEPAALASASFGVDVTGSMMAHGQNPPRFFRIRASLKAIYRPHVAWNPRTENGSYGCAGFHEGHTLVMIPCTCRPWRQPDGTPPQQGASALPKLG